MKLSERIQKMIDGVPRTGAITLSVETLWEWLSSHGKRVVVVNVPGTYPPRRVNGVLVAGFLCPTLEKISYPREVADELKSMDYRIDIDSWKARESKDDFLVEVNEALDRRFEAALSLMDRVDWDFFQLHVMETDRINHFSVYLFRRNTHRNKDFWCYTYPGRYLCHRT